MSVKIGICGRSVLQISGTAGFFPAVFFGLRGCILFFSCLAASCFFACWAYSCIHAGKALQVCRLGCFCYNRGYSCVRYDDFAAAKKYLTFAVTAEAHTGGRLFGRWDMELYSVLLVDDEREVIEVIMRRLNWEELGFRICGCAGNGAEALEMAEELQPDVVMTDIKMPYMDGLELTGRLRGLYPDIRIIIFSGFDEFEYAQEAVRLGAEEYLLKPVDSSEIRRVFGKIKRQLDEERDRRRSVERLEEYYQRSLPLLRENFFLSLVDGHMPEEKLEEYMEDYRVKLDGPLFVIAVIHVSTSQIPGGMTPRLLSFSVRELAEDYFRDRWDSYVFQYRGNSLLLSQLPAQDRVWAYTDDCDRFCRLAKRSCGAVVTVGISGAVSRVHDLPAAYEGAREALSYRILYGTQKAINIREIAPDREPALCRYDETLEGIFKQIRMGNEEELHARIEALIDRIGQSGVREYQMTLMELLIGFYRFCSDNEIEIAQIYPEGGRRYEDAYSYLRQMDTAQDLKAWLEEFSGRALAVMREQRASKTRSFVSRALEFVSDHYRDADLDLDMVCSSLGVSAAYFSTVFKKETGSSFINYLTDYRMKEARRLIDEEDEKTYIIAMKVGYADPNYFSYVFRKKFGMSPTRYKKTRESGR